jgi:hypothetical protein
MIRALVAIDWFVNVGNAIESGLGDIVPVSNGTVEMIWARGLALA